MLVHVLALEFKMCWPWNSRCAGPHITDPPRFYLPGFRGTDAVLWHANVCAFAIAVAASPSVFLESADASACSLKAALIFSCTMGVSRPQATQAGPAQSLANDLQYVREDQQHAASSTQQSSYVPPHLQATQTFFDPEPAPAAAAAPAPVAQGYTVGAINTTQPLYCPAQQVIHHTCSASYCQFQVDQHMCTVWNKCKTYFASLSHNIQVHPVFLGATVGHYPILLHCGACNYQGMTAVRQVISHLWFWCLMQQDHQHALVPFEETHLMHQ